MTQRAGVNENTKEGPSHRLLHSLVTPVTPLHRLMMCLQAKRSPKDLLTEFADIWNVGALTHSFRGPIASPRFMGYQTSRRAWGAPTEKMHMKSIRGKALTVAVSACLFATPALAALRVNGFKMNGIQFNGIKMNGLKLNGLRINGIQFNGIKFNGLEANGIRFNGYKLNGFRMNGIQFNGIQFNGMKLNGFKFNALRLNGIIANGFSFNGWRYNGFRLNTDSNGQSHHVVGISLGDAARS